MTMPDPPLPNLRMLHRPVGSLSSQIARALILLLVSVVLVSGGLLALRWSRSETTGSVAADRVEISASAGGIDAALPALEKEVTGLESANRRLRRRIASFRPRGTYLVIDTGANRMYLMKDDSVLRDALVSTGSGVRLSDPDKPRSWVFETPRGEFRILRKVNEPVWTKPDWAFVEAGEGMPRNWSDRVEPGVLGDYALDLGDGYLIHGTLFERALGLHVTHGCVRVGAADLEAIFRSVGIGTKVYIL